MSDAYAAAGVDTDQADEGVSALVAVLRTIELDQPSRSVVPSGHYASVLRVTPELGIAMATDGVGSKLVVAEQADRLETVGIDCVAMNVNDIVCVGAEPIALVDYLAVEQVDAGRLARIGEGLRQGAMAANCEIPGGELAVIPELIRGHPSPHGFDLCATAIGTVALEAIVDGSKIAEGDALIGLPASGLHSNGYTLARRALLEASTGSHPRHDALALDATPEALGGRTVADALLEPTVIYVRAIIALLRSEIAVHGLAHITGGGLTNLLRLAGDRIGYEISSPLPVLPIFGLVAERGDVTPAEMWEVFNMGCGFVVTVAAADAEAVTALLAGFHPGARVIGAVSGEAGAVTVPGLGLRYPVR